MSQKPEITHFVTNIEEAKSVSSIFAKSNVFPDARAAEQAFVKIVSGREIGLTTIASMNGLHIIDGKIALGANVIAARIKSSGKYNYRVREQTNEVCRIEFFEDGESVGESVFTIEDARAAEVSFKTRNGNAGQWAKYPRNMLFARAISNGYRWFAPDIFDGAAVYTAEELGAEVDSTGAPVIDAEFTPTQEAESAVAEMSAEPEPEAPAAPAEPPQKPVTAPAPAPTPTEAPTEATAGAPVRPMF